MPLYACNSSAGTQRRRCTSATGPLGHSDAVVRLQQLRWDAATRCTPATGPLGRSDAVVRLQRVRWDAATSLYVYNGSAGAQRSHCRRTTAFFPKFTASHCHTLYPNYTLGSPRLRVAELPDGCERHLCNRPRRGGLCRAVAWRFG